MTQWFVKDLSKLTGVSVQTLHHYDRIDLLKPSLRMTNGYRVYSEKDLLLLQQIIALKFFGFELAQIKALLQGNAGAVENFSAQVRFLEQKAQTLLEASSALKGIISEVKDDKSVPWKTIIQLIEVYRMTQRLEQSWIKEIFTPEELKQYAAFETEVRPEQKTAFKKSWSSLVKEIEKNIGHDPASETGIHLGKKCMQLINDLYGKKYAHLRTKKFEQGYAEGKGQDEIELTPEINTWLEKALDAYWRDRLYAILDQVGQTSSSGVLKLWNEAMDEMFGEDSERKNAVREAALSDDKVSARAREWLKTQVKQ